MYCEYYTALDILTYRSIFEGSQPELHPFLSLIAVFMSTTPRLVSDTQDMFDSNCYKYNIVARFFYFKSRWFRVVEFFMQVLINVAINSDLKSP